MTTTDTTGTTAPTSLTGNYTLDPAHTRIGFSARHAMVTKVRGAFNEFEGKGYIDAENPANSHFELKIKAASIDTRNADRDAHLRSNDFLAMEEHPEITFVSTEIEQVDDTHFKVTGDLAIRGVTKPITIDLEYNGRRARPLGQPPARFRGRDHDQPQGLGCHVERGPGGRWCHG